MHFPKYSHRGKRGQIRAVKGVKIVGAHLDRTVAAQQLVVEENHHLTKVNTNTDTNSDTNTNTNTDTDTNTNTVAAQQLVVEENHHLTKAKP